MTRLTLPEGELGFAEEAQAEPGRNYWPLLIPAWCLAVLALGLWLAWPTIQTWTADNRDRSAGELHNTGPVARECLL